jgi:NitT/TauT family transport system permease protein
VRGLKRARDKTTQRLDPNQRSVNLDSVLTPRRSISVLLYAGLGAGLFVILLVLWQYVAGLDVVNERFLPPPVDVVRAFTQYAGDNLWEDIWASSWRVLIGFTIAALFAVPIGLLMGSFKAVEAFFEPFTDFVRYMPAPAFIPLLIIWVGIDEPLKYAVIFIGTFFQLVLLVMDAAARVPMELINTSYTLGASKWQVVWRVIAPAVGPEVYDLLRITLGWAWTYLVVAEVVAAESGLASSIVIAGRFLRTDLVIVGIIIIGIIGMIFDFAFKVGYRYVFPYARKEY